MGDLYEILPFDNEVVVLSLTGLQVKQAIEHGLGSGQDKGFSDGQFSGVLAQVDWTKPYGQRLRSLRLTNGDMIDDDKIYKVAVNDFMAEGGDMYPLAKFKAKPSNMVMRDIAREALLKNKNIPSGDIVPVWYVDDLQVDKVNQAS
jgi:2',3'-cyclic-nucleotide 2'-phosphodiesterase/3'-nucleotidase